MRTAFALIVLLAAAPVLAQDANQASSGSAPPSTKKAPRKVIRLEAITVEGRIQKPQAMYILQRSNLSFDDLSRTESFVPKVVKSVEQEPF
ncbi:hypothetical protein [Corallococcus macrosporus]|uniref:POTRA domain-containing protein n=2 Tax=Myxococcaceae TaxID=31 RepID=A0A250JSC4_9BACT|nr:hypothetical protein [Corallococcus macrosporus]AEI65387.1 hypothetical protein LILAB_17425 [Corallococcus macrosporus]ATB46382.1 hypothetical protein MYMAC_001975 [Corallococcus macrosporus DSM 14697]